MSDAIDNQSAEPGTEKRAPGGDRSISVDGWTIGDRYEMLGQIGSGGMGVVYKARHVMMDKLVAIKTLKMDNMLDESAQKRFEHEAKLCAKLSHTNVVSVHDFGVSGKLLYLVMDYVDGKTLAQILDVDSCISVQRTIEIMTQIADGLDHAHQYGVIHRDLKPSNIMIVKTPSGQHVPKIVDFGLAKATLQEGAVQQLTQTGVVMGSPIYMSPEQCLGKKPDRRSDIYALGCVLYEMLVGMPAFVGENVLETIRKHTDENPLPINEIREDLKFPTVLEDVILKALSKNPEHRFQSATEFKQALLDAGNAIVSTGGKPHVRSHHSQRITATSLMLPVKNNSISKGIGIAVSIGAALLVVAAVISLKHDGTVSGSSTAVVAGGGAGSQDAGTDFSAGQVALLKGQYPESENLFRQALAKAKSQEPDSPPGRLTNAITGKLIDVLYIEKKFAEADALSASIGSDRKPDAVAETSTNSDAADTANDRLVRLAMACHKNGQCDTAVSILEHSVNLSKRVYGADSPQTLAKMRKLAELYETLGEEDKADKLTLEIMQKQAGKK